ncbi:MAG: sigma-70 family RNA polymerase sigma factor [Bacteroidaceae bacterium]|nr:sigma-70 family RNA polymerase sigma factor [Bacteroidaceae bacterium]
MRTDTYGMEKETQTLIQALCRQDGQAQRRVLQLYGAMIFGQVARIVTCLEDAEEVYQDVFVKVFRNIESYDSRQASLATWMSRIAYNESLNFVRRAQQPLIYVDDRDVDLESIQNEALAQVFQQQDEATIQLIERALDYLLPEELALITMFYYDDMSLKDIAYATDSAPSTVASRLSRTRRKLYRIIQSLGNE